MKRRLVYRDKTTHKVWEIELEGASFRVRFGRSGAVGQEKSKAFASEAVAKKAATSFVAQKLAKGYRDAPVAVIAPEPTADVAIQAGAALTTLELDPTVRELRDFVDAHPGPQRELAHALRDAWLERLRALDRPAQERALRVIAKGLSSPKLAKEREAFEQALR
jgi:predicted DNA-binding WGR domain protein